MTVDLKALAERVIALVNGGRWEIDTFYSWRDDAPSAVLDLIAERDSAIACDFAQRDAHEAKDAYISQLQAKVVRLKGRIERVEIEIKRQEMERTCDRPAPIPEEQP